MICTCRSRPPVFVVAFVLLTAATWTQAAHENDMCDNVAACIPPEPTGNAVEICSIFLKSVTCMEDAVDACRRIPNFSQDLLAESEARIMELRSELAALSCLDDSTLSEPMQDVTLEYDTETETEKSNVASARTGPRHLVVIGPAITLLASCVFLRQ